jgi:membrane protease YdiL (CAAX protease family)
VLWLPALLVLVVVAGALPAGLDRDHVKVAIQVPTFTLTGFLEETEYRGLILGVLVSAWADQGRAGRLAAVAASAALFGAAHLSNAGRLAPALVANQVVYTVLFGVGFAAIRLRTNTLWPLIVFHSTIDVVGALTPDSSTTRLTATTVLVSQLPSLLLAGYGLFVLRKAPLPAASITARHTAAKRTARHR